MLIMVWIFVPSVRCSGMFGVSTLIGGVWRGRCKWDDVGGGVGIVIGIYQRVSLMVLGACLYLERNSLRVNIAKVALC